MKLWNLLRGHCTTMEQRSLEEHVDTRENCAWCLKEQGRPMGNGSHGICSHHAAQMQQESKERGKS
jgi:hypothetical protein